MRRLIVAAALAGFALSAFAQDDVVAASADACPGGTVAVVPVYKWQDGHFVADGWVCQSLDSGG